jgi:hypothetical protein
VENAGDEEEDCEEDGRPFDGGVEPEGTGGVEPEGTGGCGVVLGGFVVRAGNQ